MVTICYDKDWSILIILNAEEKYLRESSLQSYQLMVAYRRHMAPQNWANIGSGDGLLPDGIKPLPEPILYLSSMRFCDMQLRAISLEVPKLKLCFD